MAEVLNPSSDGTLNFWTNQAGSATNIYQTIDEGTADDADYVQSSAGADSTLYYEAILEAGTDPVASGGHTVRYRYRKNAGGTTDLTASLRQGTGTEIAAWTHNGIGTSWTQADQTLTGGQADAITNYADLRIRFAPTAAAEATPAIVASSTGTVSNLTGQSSTGLTVTSGMAGAIQVGHYMIAWVAVDNSGGGGARPGLTITDPRSNTWTVTTGALQDPGTASSGTACYIAYAKVTTVYQGNDTITFNWGSGSPAAKSISVSAFSGIHSTTPVAVSEVAANAASTAFTISITPSAAKQLVVAAGAIEGPSGDTWTDDADSTNGSWTAITEVSTGNTGVTDQTLQGAFKAVTASGAQTWNSTITSRDWAANAIVFAPEPASRAQVSWTNLTTPYDPPFDPLTSIGWVEAHWAGDPGWTPPSDGGEVTTWRDGSGNSRTITTTAGQGPTYRAAVTALNGKPAVEFDGVNDRLRNSSSYTQAQPFTVVAVLNDWDVAIANARFFGASSDTVQIFAETGGWTNAYTVTANGATIAAELVENDTGPNVYVTVFQGPTTMTVKDGVNSRPATSGGGDPGTGSITSGPTLGMRDSQTLPGHFQCGFMGVYSGDFRSDPNYADFLQWASAQYAIPFPVLAQSLGTATGTSASTTTTLAFTGDEKPQADDFVIFYGARDSAAGDAVTDSVSDGAGNTYTVSTNVGGTGTAGVVAVIAYSKLTTGWGAGTNTLTWTHPSVDARSLIGDHWKGVQGLRSGSTATQDQIDGATTFVNSSTINAGDLVVGCIAAEYGSDVAPTVVDTDVGNGAWSGIRYKGNGTASTSGVKVASQWKVVSTGGYQELDIGGFGATTGVDVASILLAFEPSTVGPTTVNGTAATDLTFAGPAVGTAGRFGVAATDLVFTATATVATPYVPGAFNLGLSEFGGADQLGGVTATSTAATDLTFTAPATGTVTAEEVTGVADTTLTFAGPAVGIRTAVGSTADTTISFAGPAVGTRTVTGAADTTLAFTGPAVGTVTAEEIFGVAASSFVYAAPATGTVTVNGAADTTLAFTAPAVGTVTADEVTGVATTDLAFTAPATGTVTAEEVAGVAVSSFAFDAPATGTRTAVGSTAVTTIAFAAPAVGTRTVAGSAATSITFAAPATGTRLAGNTAPVLYADATGVLYTDATVVYYDSGGAAADTALTFAAPATGTRTAVGSTAASTFTFTGPAVGTVTAEEVTGVAASAFAFTVPAVGSVTVNGVADTTLAFTGPATGTVTAEEVTGVADTTLTFAAPAVGTRTVPGTADTTLTFAGPAVGTVTAEEVTGVADTTLAFTAPAAGTGTVNGTADTTITFTADAVGTVIAEEVTGTADTTLTFAGPATGTVTVNGAAVTSLAFDATATGTRTTAGTADTTLTFAGPAAGTVVIGGTAVTTLVFTADADGTVVVPGAGVASTDLAFAAPATGTVTRYGTADTTLALDASATGTVTHLGTAETALTFAAPAAGTVTVTGAAATALAFDAPATGAGNAEVTGTAETALTYTAPAVGTVTVAGVATAALTFAGPATGLSNVLGAADATITFAGPATGVRSVTGTAAGTFAYTAPAIGTITGDVTAGMAAAVFIFVAAAYGTRSTGYLEDIVDVRVINTTIEASVL